MAGMYCLADLVGLAVRERAEELLIEAGAAPRMLARGASRNLDLPSLTDDEVAGLLRSLASPEQLQELERCGNVQFNHVFPTGRFGVKAAMAGSSVRLRMRNLER